MSLLLFEKIKNCKEAKGNSGIHLKSFETDEDPCLGDIALGPWRDICYSVFDVVL